MTDTVQFQKVSSQKSWMIPVVVVLVVILSFAFIWRTFLRPSSVTRTISVAGVAKKTAKVANAQVVIQFSTRNEDRNFVSASGEKRFQDLVERLAAFGSVTVEQSGAQILAVSSLPQSVFEYRKTAKVTITDPAVIPGVLDFLKIQEVTLAQTLFIPENEKEVRAELLQKAVEEAKQRASTLAEASKGRVGKVMSVSEVAPGQEQGNVLSSGSTGEQIEMTATVNVIFALD